MAMSGDCSRTTWKEFQADRVLSNGITLPSMRLKRSTGRWSGSPDSVFKLVNTSGGCQGDFVLRKNDGMQRDDSWRTIYRGNCLIVRGLPELATQLRSTRDTWHRAQRLRDPTMVMHEFGYLLSLDSHAPPELLGDALPRGVHGTLTTSELKRYFALLDS